MKAKRSNKCNAKKVVVDNIKFDSKKEAERYKVLKRQEANGEIQNLQLQVKFDLIPPAYEEIVTYTPKTHKEKKKKVKVESGVTYVADFIYIKDGQRVVEDVKGYRGGATYNIFVIKRKLMLYVHGIRVVEV